MLQLRTAQCKALSGLSSPTATELRPNVQVWAVLQPYMAWQGALELPAPFLKYFHSY